MYHFSSDVLDASADIAAPVLRAEAPLTAEAGNSVDVMLTGAPSLGGTPLTVRVLAGGGVTGDAEINAEGKGTLRWTLGVVPVPQRVEISDGQTTITVEIQATRTAPLQAAPFGDVLGFLDGEGSSDSTEDLVVLGAPDRVLMGAPGGLIDVAPDGKVTRRTLTGDAPGKGWGLAAAKDGTVWVVDLQNQRLVTVSPEGEAKAVLTGFPDMAGGAELPFDGLNDTELGPDGHVYATDPCRARLLRYDPAAGKVVAVLTLDPSVDGGPNGMTFDAEGALFYSTENPALLCNQADVAPLDAKLASIVRVAPTEDGFGEREVIAPGIGVFGDGLTMDAEGNLYAVVDQVDLEKFALAESAVWVFPGGRGPGHKLVVAKDVLFANVGIGRGELGDTLYIALLAAPPFTTLDSRGLQRVPIGIARAPWLSP